MPLTFVNRYSEALDILVPNLLNTDMLDVGADIKFDTPLAAQLPGAGKTALGVHITSILRRPRDPPDLEGAIAQRMKQAWCLGKGRINSGYVDRALQAGGEHNLVMRTLLTAFPNQRELLLKLMHTQPLLIRMKDVVNPQFGLEFDAALAFAIFCTSRGLDGSDPEAEDAFRAQRSGPQSARGAVRALIKSKGSPLMLVLDDITDLGRIEFEGYFKSVDRDTTLHRAMHALSGTLQALHGVHGCLVYCTGRSLWLTTLALVGVTSPLFVTPALLQPLSHRDVLEIMHLTQLPDGTALQDALGVPPAMLSHFAQAAVQLSGGLGRPLQYLLRHQQSIAESAAAAGRPLLLGSEKEVDKALEECMGLVGNIPGLKQLHVQWDGPAAAVRTGDLPAWTQERGYQLQLLHRLARLLLLDVSFPAAATVGLGSSRGLQAARVVDLAMALGIHYVPAPGDRVRLIAGTWLCRSLVHDPVLAEGPRTLTTARMLDAMLTFGGTMRGRPFELLCADALCFRHMMLVGRLSTVQPVTAPTLGMLLPHCQGSKLGLAQLEQMKVVIVPKVMGGADTHRLTDDVKTALCTGSREKWSPAGCPKGVIHVDNLPWLLSTWLSEGSLAVPGSAQSGSQDLFLRVPGGVVGFALKAVGEPGTTWTDLRDELGKAPKLPADTPYVLVLWSLCLSSELQEALAEASYARYGPGCWVLDAKTKALRLATAKDLKAAKAKALKVAKKQPSLGDTGSGDGVVGKFTVPPGMELIIANPHAPTGGGLAELLGYSLLQKLQQSRDSLADVRTLDDWMAVEAASG